jgi:large subunit ribosomal protein L22
MTKALLKNYRQSPRKVRLIADAIRGKKVDVAITELSFMAKRGAEPVKKVLESAIANAKNAGIDTKNLFVKEITVDEGVTLKRWRPKWRGTAHPIRKRTSHVKIVLGTKDDKKQVVAEKKEESLDLARDEAKASKTPVKKAPAKKKATKKAVTKTKK